MVMVLANFKALFPTCIFADNYSHIYHRSNRRMRRSHRQLKCGMFSATENIY